MARLRVGGLLLLTALVAAGLPTEVAGADDTARKRARRSGAAEFHRATISPRGTAKATEPTSSRFSPAAVGSNVRLNQDATSLPQNEPFVVVDPTDQNRLVAGANDYRSGQGESGVYISADGGATWSDSGVGGILPMPAGVDSSGDPSLAYNRDGTKVLYSQLGFVQGAFGPGGEGGCDATSGIYVNTSTNDGVSWSAGVNVAPNSPTVFTDKEMIAVDRTAGIGGKSGNVYVSYTKFIYATHAACKNALTQSSSPIKLRRSTNGGSTWSAEVDVSGSFDQSQGSIPAVSPDGTLHVAFESFGPGCAACIVVAKSTDGGASFSTPVEVADITPLEQLAAGGGKSFRANSFPSLAADPGGGSVLYVVWAEKRGASSHTDVWFSKSTNGGTAWSIPIKVNQDLTANDQFFPWMAVDDEGTIWVGYFDRRDDASNILYREYVSHSEDQGATWADVQVATESSDPGEVLFGSALFIGDYSALAAIPGRGVFAAWCDTREPPSDEDIYGAKVVPPNAAPLLSAPSALTVREGSTLSFTVTASDPDAGQVVSLSATGLPAGASFVPTLGNPATGAFTWTPTPQQARATPYAVTFTATDDGVPVRTRSKTTSITVTAPGPGLWQDNSSVWRYQGSWATHTSSAYSGGTRHWANSSGAQATIAVNGGGIRIIATKASNMGKARIALDGAGWAYVDLYSSLGTNQAVVFERGLSSGIHTIAFQWTGLKSSASTRAAINLDAILILKPFVGKGTWQDSSSAWTYTGPWSRHFSSAYSGGSRRYSDSPGARAAIAVRGSLFKIMATRARAMGIMRVFVDNVLVARVNLYSASTTNRVIVYQRSLSAGTHVVRVEWSGTKDSRATDTAINLDALLLS